MYFKANTPWGICYFFLYLLHHCFFSRSSPLGVYVYAFGWKKRFLHLNETVLPDMEKPLS